MVHRACKLARACVPAVEPVAFTTDVRPPNITGELPSVRSYGTGTGAFYQGETGYGYSHISSTGRDSVAFSAGRSSSLYEEASTVQPASTRMLLCIKT